MRFCVTTVLMGYGHLRAADNVASLGEAELLRVDRAPFVGRPEKLVWNLSHWIYHSVSRTADGRHPALWRVLEKIEEIPDDADGSLRYAKFIQLLARLGMGRTFCQAAQRFSVPVLHTFFVPALYAIYRNSPGRNYVLLCDCDFHRAWAPVNPADERLAYLVPLERGADRLMQYGVPAEQISVTGFPLPEINTGGPDLGRLRQDFDARLRRLSPQSDEPLTAVFSVSGAGCFGRLLLDIVRETAPMLRSRSLRLVCAVYDHRKLRDALETLRRTLGLEDSGQLEILYDADVRRGFNEFNRTLRQADLLLTKPSEMVFYAGLGMPQALLPPVGPHEARNREYLMESGAAMDFPDAARFGQWALDRRRDGSWQRAAESAFKRLRQDGTFRIHECIAQGAGFSRGA